MDAYSLARSRRLLLTHHVRDLVTPCWASFFWTRRSPVLSSRVRYIAGEKCEIGATHLFEWRLVPPTYLNRSESGRNVRKYYFWQDYVRSSQLLNRVRGRGLLIQDVSGSGKRSA